MRKTKTDIYHTWKFPGFGNVVNSSFEKAYPPISENFYMLMLKKNGKFLGYTTTNSLYGEFTIYEKNIKIKILSATHKGEIGNGYKYLDALLLIESYEIAKNKLKLYYNQGQNYLLFNLLS